MQPLNVRIRLARLARGLEQKELAKRLSIAAQHVSQWERGGMTPRRDNFEKIAAVTGVSDLWLFTGEGWMAYFDWPSDLQGWLQGQFLLHDVQRVVIVSSPEWIILRVGFLLEIAEGILSAGALRKPRSGWTLGAGRDAEAYYSIVSDLKRRGVPTGQVMLEPEQASRLGDLSKVVPDATYPEGLLDREIADIPPELRPSFDRAAQSIVSSVSGDRSPRGESVDESGLDRLVLQADDEMKGILTMLLRTADADTRTLIGRLLRETNASVKKEMIRHLDRLREHVEREDQQSG